ncbi:MAG: hypothetical protein QHH15_07410 [Candidatus Thermoplasmatota archaeon]|jgi:hypothetical protein|nr:hypothetical protein [Candidatus Thermoplasmatota archaeon]
MIILLLTGLTISPAIGSIIEASDSQNITIYFWDLTGEKPVKKEIEFTNYQWNVFNNQIKDIKTTSSSIEESLNAQFSLFKEYGLVSYDITYEILEEKAKQAFSNKNHNLPRSSLADNIIFNAICAIDFELSNGTTFVFGLNTFMNLIGFDIISFHKGYTHGGIHTSGLLKQSTDPGTYLGFMFGLLGYWYGTKAGTGRYSDLTVAGFTVFTFWLPIGR